MLIKRASDAEPQHQVVRQTLEEWAQATTEPECPLTDFTFTLLPGESVWGGKFASGTFGPTWILHMTYNASRFTDRAAVEQDAQKVAARLKEAMQAAAVPVYAQETKFLGW